MKHQAHKKHLQDQWNSVLENSVSKRSQPSMTQELLRSFVSQLDMSSRCTHRWHKACIANSPHIHDHRFLEEVGEVLWARQHNISLLPYMTHLQRHRPLASYTSNLCPSLEVPQYYLESNELYLMLNSPHKQG
jgi:hypothetical protein